MKNKYDVAIWMLIYLLCGLFIGLYCGLHIGVAKAQALVKDKINETEFQCSQEKIDLTKGMILECGNVCRQVYVEGK